MLFLYDGVRNCKKKYNKPIDSLVSIGNYQNWNLELRTWKSFVSFFFFLKACSLLKFSHNSIISHINCDLTFVRESCDIFLILTWWLCVLRWRWKKKENICSGLKSSRLQKPIMIIGYTKKLLFCVRYALEFFLLHSILFWLCNSWFDL